MVELDFMISSKIKKSTRSLKVMVHFIWLKVAINSRTASESERWRNEAKLNMNET